MRSGRSGTIIHRRIPVWEQEWHREACTEGGYNPGVPKTTGHHSTLAGTISAGQENLHAFIRNRVPDRGHQNPLHPDRCPKGHL